jgi:F-type H+-transporting ATPase subunit b
MSILEQLGINHTYFYQLAIFVFALIVLSQFVFKDFLALLERREGQTTGTESVVQEEILKAQNLSQSYEALARDVNGQIRSIFDSYREEAAAEYQKIVAQARSESARLIEDNRQRVSMELAEAGRQLQQELPGLSQAIVQKLISKTTGKAV